ncbi:MAG: hypothetical protein DRO88_11765 [Promethearchaeia archaeon]|nr:MAG: hypothetical protein DRO88_11765 [Candidatus Lokiarchaeia archaeon]
MNPSRSGEPKKIGEKTNRRKNGKLILQLRLWFIGSGILWWISMLVPLTSFFPLILMFQVVGEGWERFLYSIPLINGGLMIIFGIFLSKFIHSQKLGFYLILFLDLNLTTLFLSQIFQDHTPYLWNQPGIYLIITALILFLGCFLGFLQINSPSPSYSPSTPLSSPPLSPPSTSSSSQPGENQEDKQPENSQNLIPPQNANSEI